MVTNTRDDIHYGVGATADFVAPGELLNWQYSTENSLLLFCVLIHFPLVICFNENTKIYSI
jgi:hypothetical protein